MPGNRYDSIGVPPLIDGVAFDDPIADKDFDSDALAADLNERGAAIAFPSSATKALLFATTQAEIVETLSPERST